MVSEYKIIFSKLADKDKKLLKQAGLEDKTMKLLDIIADNPYQIPPSYEKLRGNLDGLFSRRISLQHRLVYKVYEDTKEVFIVRMWSHYDKVKQVDLWPFFYIIMLYNIYYKVGDNVYYDLTKQEYKKKESEFKKKNIGKTLFTRCIA